MMNEASTLFDVSQVVHSGYMSLKLVRIARLKLLSQQRKMMGPVELGLLIGRKPNQTSDLLNGRASFGEKVARSIEETVGLPSGWLDQTDGSGVAPPNAVMEADPEAYYSPELYALQVPVLATEGSMGSGADQHDDVLVGRLSLSPTWINKTIPALTRPENLRFIHGYGDSMCPTFGDGDMLLVDGGIRDIMIDGIYVLEAKNRLFIKRVRQRLDGSFEISSDNPTVKTVDVLDGKHIVTVLGRVVWAWNGKKL